MTEIPVPTTPTQPSSTRTLFAQIVAALMAALDQFMDAITDFGESEGVARNLIEKKRRTRPAFVNNDVSALLTDTDLQTAASLWQAKDRRRTSSCRAGTVAPGGVHVPAWTSGPPHPAGCHRVAAYGLPFGCY